MKQEPIDYNSPLGISKREWTKVLGANLALLLLVYAIALICTLCGSDFFVLNFNSEALQNFENTLRSWNMFPIVQCLFLTIEATIMACYVAKAKPKWWVPFAYYVTVIGLDLLFMVTTGVFPTWLTPILYVLFCIFCVFCLNGWKPREKWFIYLFRLAIALVVSLVLSYGITLFRLHGIPLWSSEVSNSIGFAFSVEYDLALGLALGFLTLLIPWKRKGGNEQCLTYPGASGSCPNASPSSQSSSPNIPSKPTLDKNLKRRYMLLKISIMALQTISLALVAIVPWFFGRQVEFALVFASFTLVRLMLGFDRSFHAESEVVCIFVGTLIFWALTLLTTDVRVSIIVSLAYGGGTALALRLYWELHDLMAYKKVAKIDRYAMLYCFFDGDVSHDMVKGMLMMHGYQSETDIEMVAMYMAKEKVDYIAKKLGFAKITIEKRLTEIATDLYAKR